MSSPASSRPACVRCGAPLVAFHEPLCVACGEKVARALHAVGLRPVVAAERITFLGRATAALAALPVGFSVAALAAFLLGNATPNLAISAAVLGLAGLAAFPMVVTIAQLASSSLLQLARDVGPSLGSRSFLVIVSQAVKAPATAPSEPSPLKVGDALASYSPPTAPPSTSRRQVPGLFVVGDNAVALYRPVAPGARTGLDDVEHAPLEGVQVLPTALGRLVFVTGGGPDRSLGLALDLTPTPGFRVAQALARAVAVVRPTAPVPAKTAS